MAVTMSDKSISTEDGLTSGGLTFNKIFAMFHENDRIMKETIREMDLLTEQMSGLCRNFGEVAERLADQSIIES